ncbi:ECF transporter S component [Clostridium thermarum]|uniref:ECF transporter S component n=1 Tax=Clostridium thermarum TaxID=1716543 RepID=UPI00111F4CD4|nr:ECF transporter S component [Clostridium thermarum]
MSNVSTKTSYLVKLSLLAAISVVLMYLEFPLLPAFPWLKIDGSDLPALIGSFAFGPITGVAIEALKNVLIILIKGTETAGIGQLANFIIGATFVGTAGMIYKYKKTRTNAIISMAVATVVMSIIGIFANIFILIPLYMPGMSSADLMNYVTKGIVPFNLIKGLGVSIITLLVYKRISVIINREGFQYEGEKISKKTA